MSGAQAAMAFNLQLPYNAWFKLDGRPMQARGRTLGKPSLLLFRFQDREVKAISDEQFLTLKLRKELKAMSTAELHLLLNPGTRPLATAETGTKEKRESKMTEVTRRLAYLRAWQDAGCPSRNLEMLTPLIKRVAEEIKDAAPSVRTVQRWLAAWLKSNRNADALVPQHENAGNTERKLGREAALLLSEIVEEWYLTDERHTAVAVYDHVVTEFDDLNKSRPEELRIAVPSLAATYAEINRIDPYTRNFCRFGKTRAEHLYRMQRPAPRALKHNARWEIDHTTGNLIVIDEESGLPLGRPTITAIIDCFSRMIVGYYIGFDGPGHYATMEALRIAILPKNDFLAAFPGAVWPCIGKPVLLVPDNAKHFRSDTMLEILSRLGIDADYAPVMKAWYKARIERFFKTLEISFVHRLPGTTFSNIFERNSERPPESVAVLSLTEFRALTGRFILEVYHKKLHRGLEMSPLDAWNQSVAEHGNEDFPDPDTLNQILSLLEDRTLQRDGIVHERLQYHSPELAALAMRLGHGVSVQIKVDQLDLTHIWVVDPETSGYIEAVVCPEDRIRVHGCTLEKWKLMRAIELANPDRYVGTDAARRVSADLDKAMREKTGASGRATRRAGAAYQEKLMRAAMAADGRKAPDDGTALANASEIEALFNVVLPPQVTPPSAPAPAAVPAPGLSATVVRILEEQPAREPSGDDEAEFDPAEYARQQGYNIHKRDQEPK